MNMTIIKNHGNSTGEISCEALGCDSQAKVNLVVKVGDRGSISLSLCQTCKTKFDKGAFNVDLGSVI